MNMKIGWRTVVLVLSSLVMTVGFSACGSSDQSNPPLTNTNSVVELISGSLQYDAAGTTISGTITTNYPTALTGAATLSGFSADLTGCNVSSVAIGTGDTITYTDNNNVISNVVITLAAGCSATSVILHATETDESNATSAWSGITAVSASSDITSSIAVITADDITLTQNSESRQIVLKVWDKNNAPVTSGSISVRYPSEVLNNIPVGSLTPANTATIVDGKATFDYTGPSDLSALVNDKNITSATFVFYDTANESTFASVTVNYNPDSTVPPAVLTSYTVTFVSSTGSVTTNLESTEVFTLSVTDDQGNLVAGTDVNATIISNQPNLAKFLDENGTEVTSLSFVGTNPSTLRLKTYQKAGLADFGVQLQIKDVNGAVGDKNVTKMVTIFSGPATVITIHYASTDLNKDYMIFSENMVVRLADKWDNPVNTHPKIFVSGVAGYKKTPLAPSGVGNDYLIDRSLSATVAQDSIGAKLTVTSGMDLSDIDVYNDVLMTYGTDYKFHASGKWDIDSVVGADIFLNDSFNSATPVDGIAFAIGRNYRNDLCTNDKYVLNVDSSDGTYEVNSDGVAVVSMTYEPRAVGQKIMMNVNVLGMVNSLGEEIRLGEIEEHTLRGHGLSSPGGITVAANESGSITFHIALTDTPEFLRNARFNFLSERTGDVNATCIPSDMNKTVQYSTTNCQSWITCDYAAGPTGGSINIKSAILSDEF